MINIERFAGVQLSFTEAMQGYVSLDNGQGYEEGYLTGAQNGLSLIVDLIVTIPDFKKFLTDPQHKGIVEGTIRILAESNQGDKLRSGEFKLFNKDESGIRHLQYDFIYGDPETRSIFHGIKNIHDDPGFDSLTDITTLFVNIENEQGEKFVGKILFKATDFPSLFASIKVDTDNLITSMLAKAAFIAFCAEEMSDEYLLGKVR